MLNKGSVLQVDDRIIVGNGLAATANRIFGIMAPIIALEANLTVICPVHTPSAKLSKLMLTDIRPDLDFRCPIRPCGVDRVIDTSRAQRKGQSMKSLGYFNLS